MFTSLLTKTPSLTYQQRKTAGHVVARVNDGLLPAKWAGLKRGVQVKHYNEITALTTPYQHMFQKVSEKALGKLVARCLQLLSLDSKYTI